MGISYYTQAPFLERNNFGYLLNQMGLVGDAVEVGTHRGQFASHLLERWNGNHLHCVDPWSIPEGYEEQAKQLCNSNGDRNADFQECNQALFSHRCRVTYLRMLSEEGATHFKDGSLDFIYIDGDHRPDMVMKDLCLWFPKLCSRGILAGHDILMPGEVDGRHARDIQITVSAFASYYSDLIEGQAIHLIVEKESLPWSFYIIKA